MIARYSPRIVRLMDHDENISQSQIYEELALQHADSIRLFRLKPSIASTCPIELELYTVRLQDVMNDFDALSYTWGSPHEEIEVLINRDSVRIGRNLHDFLHCLRENAYLIPLWADAICINQQNDNEKTRQVRLMGRIYSFSTCTRTWLGGSMTDLAKLMHIYGKEGRLCWTEQASKALSSKVPAILDSLLEYSYWTRTWIVQEVLLAKQVLLHCGEETLPWHQFVKMAKRLCARAGQNFLAKFGSSQLMRLNSQILRNEPRTLLDLLENHGSTACANIRDRVFAMVGLININGDPLGPQASQSTAMSAVLDYSLTVPSLFVKLVQVYEQRLPPRFVSILWNTLKLYYYDFTNAELSYYSVRIHGLYWLEVDPFFNLPHIYRNFSSDTLGLWAMVEFPWSKAGRKIYWKLSSPNAINSAMSVEAIGLLWERNENYEDMKGSADRCAQEAANLRICLGTSEHTSIGKSEILLTLGCLRVFLNLTQARYGAFSGRGVSRPLFALMSRQDSQPLLECIHQYSQKLSLVEDMLYNEREKYSKQLTFWGLSRLQRLISLENRMVDERHFRSQILAALLEGSPQSGNHTFWSSCYQRYLNRWHGLEEILSRDGERFDHLIAVDLLLGEDSLHQEWYRELSRSRDNSLTPMVYFCHVSSECPPTISTKFPIQVND